MFAALHIPGTPLLMPNPWDAGSAVMLKTLGFQALGSTSAGAAFAAGRREGALSLSEMLHAARAIKQASGLPVSADLENGGGDNPDAVDHAIREAGALGLDGASIEDLAADGTTYPLNTSIARVEAAVAAARDSGVVLTARAEGLIGNAPDIADVCTRIAAFARAGADVVFAPGLRDAAMVKEIMDAANGTPVSVILGGRYAELTVASLSNLGVARISLGSSLARAAYGAALRSAHKFLKTGDYIVPEDTFSFEEIEALLPR
jgi:2-methylisocitrate lyase-like PEP mutase family enzyme